MKRAHSTTRPEEAIEDHQRSAIRRKGGLSATESSVSLCEQIVTVFHLMQGADKEASGATGSFIDFGKILRHSNQVINAYAAVYLDETMVPFADRKGLQSLLIELENDVSSKIDQRTGFSQIDSVWLQLIAGLYLRIFSMFLNLYRACKVVKQGTRDFAQMQSVVDQVVLDCLLLIPKDISSDVDTRLNRMQKIFEHVLFEHFKKIAQLEVSSLVYQGVNSQMICLSSDWSRMTPATKTSCWRVVKQALNSASCTLRLSLDSVLVYNFEHVSGDNYSDLDWDSEDSSDEDERMHLTLKELFEDLPQEEVDSVIDRSRPSWAFSKIMMQWKQMLDNVIEYDNPSSSHLSAQSNQSGVNNLTQDQQFIADVDRLVDCNNPCAVQGVTDSPMNNLSSVLGPAFSPGFLSGISPYKQGANPIGDAYDHIMSCEPSDEAIHTNRRLNFGEQEVAPSPACLEDLMNDKALEEALQEGPEEALEARGNTYCEQLLELLTDSKLEPMLALLKNPDKNLVQQPYAQLLHCGLLEKFNEVGLMLVSSFEVSNADMGSKYCDFGELLDRTAFKLDLTAEKSVQEVQSSSAHLMFATLNHLYNAEDEVPFELLFRLFDFLQDQYKWLWLISPFRHARTADSLFCIETKTQTLVSMYAVVVVNLLYKQLIDLDINDVRWTRFADGFDKFISFQFTISHSSRPILKKSVLQSAAQQFLKDVRKHIRKKKRTSK